MIRPLILTSIFTFSSLFGESVFTAEEFKTRRTKLAEAIPENAIAIFQGAPSETGYVKFRQYLSLIHI